MGGFGAKHLMRVLILGGTRFVGFALARLLADAGHKVTACSRRPENVPQGVHPYGGERSSAIPSLAQEQLFDVVVDFTAYDADSAGIAIAAFSRARYFLISSIWVTRLQRGMSADTPAPTGVFAPHCLPDVTRKYIEGKVGAESQVHKAHSIGRVAVALRLPIMWGANDHTPRLEYYRRRVKDGAEQILIDGGANRVQLGWSEDTAGAIARLVTIDDHELPPLIDGLPDNGITVSDLNALIAGAEEAVARPFAVPQEILAREFPAFLAYEPLWREEALPLSNANLFKFTAWKPRDLRNWISDLVRQVPLRLTGDEQRAEELAFLKKHRHA